MGTTVVFAAAMLAALVAVEVVHRRLGLQVIVTAIVCGYVLGMALGGVELGALQLPGLVAPGAGPVFARDLTEPVTTVALALLMFSAGAQIPFETTQGRDADMILRLVAGTGIAFVASFAVFGPLFLQPDIGAALDIGAGDPFRATLIVALCTFVTSLPFLTKIFQSLGMLRTGICRNVLMASCIGDVFVYVATTVFIGLATVADGWTSQIAIRLTQLALFIGLFAILFRLRQARPPRAEAWLLPGVAALAAAGAALDIGAMLTGLFAGMYFGDRGWRWLLARRFSAGVVSQMGTLYFVLVGLSLTTQLRFDVLLFAVFLTLSSAIKFVSVLVAVAPAGLHTRSALCYAMAMNTRGGPGIVLGSIFFMNGLIGQDFFIVLIMTSIVTAMMTEVFLKRMGAARLEW